MRSLIKFFYILLIITILAGCSSRSIHPIDNQYEVESWYSIPTDRTDILKKCKIQFGQRLLFLAKNDGKVFKLQVHIVSGDTVEFIAYPQYGFTEIFKAELDKGQLQFSSGENYSYQNAFKHFFNTNDSISELIWLLIGFYPSSFPESFLVSRQGENLLFVHRDYELYFSVEEDTLLYNWLKLFRRNGELLLEARLLKESIWEIDRSDEDEVISLQILKGKSCLSRDN